MSGWILAAGTLTLACGAGPADVGPAYLPGTDGTVLLIPPGDKINIQRVRTAGGPEVRLTYGRRWVQAPVIRFSRAGSLCDVWVTRRDYSTNQYPKGEFKPPRPRAGESPEQYVKRYETWHLRHRPRAAAAD